MAGVPSGGCSTWLGPRWALPFVDVAVAALPVEFMKQQFRLRHSSDFLRVRRDGGSYASSLAALAFLQNELDYSRFGFVVSKRLGKAVHRNKVKRRMREVVRLHLPRIKPGFDVVIIARQPAREAGYAEIEQALLRLLAKAGLLLPEARVGREETQLQRII